MTFSCTARPTSCRLLLYFLPAKSLVLGFVGVFVFTCFSPCARFLLFAVAMDSIVFVGVFFFVLTVSHELLHLAS